jgi:hypothetical protein
MSARLIVKAAVRGVRTGYELWFVRLGVGFLPALLACASDRMSEARRSLTTGPPPRTGERVRKIINEDKELLDELA